MNRTINKDIAAAANAETLQDYITGKDNPVITVKAIRFEYVADMDVRGYIDQDRIVDFGGECAAVVPVEIPVNRLLAKGETFRAGFLNGTGGALTKKLTVILEETPA